ncbi:MAG: UDP-N-acetylmuramate dehydrogenase [Phycisphaerales bacterium]|nr:UDP-N-acetylmuramate dehydrogenase [Phycisphaerales bacterium]
MTTMTTLREQLWSDLDVEATLDAPIGALTWYEAGGRAEVLILPRTIESLQVLCRRCCEQGIAVRTLGSGANLIVDDAGVNGVVVRLSRGAFQATAWPQETAGGLAHIGAGADLMSLVQESARRGLAGLSQLAGIPASLGGAVRMNAGGSFGDTAQSIHTIELLTPVGEICIIPKVDLGFAYRTCNLPAGIVLAATVALAATDPVKVRAHVKEVFEYKSRTQPMSDRSAGCMFKNPIDPSTGQRQSAGRLIDLAGMKGTTLRSAFVSERHGNFIGLHAGGSTNDVLALALAVQQRVLDHAGIRLEREVVVWSQRGEDS